MVNVMPEPKPPYTRSLELLSRKECKLLIVDVQEKLVPKIFELDRLLANCRTLIQGAKILGVPVYATEQYPRGLGSTVPQLAELLERPAQKLRFSCAEVLAWDVAAGQTDNRFQVVVAGMEAHVCVLQTVLDLLASGFQVYVPADAISSRNEFDWKIALDRMSAGGATIVTTESVLFEWCEVSGTPEFKQISQLIKDREAR
jgi:nicotinamidase-related amidase